MSLLTVQSEVHTVSGSLIAMMALTSLKQIVLWTFCGFLFYPTSACENISVTLNQMSP